AIGVLAASFSILPMLLSLQAGKLSDRFGARWLMTLGAIGSAVGMLIPAAWPAVMAIFVAATLSGLSTTFYNVSLQNLVGLLSRPDTRAQAFSNYSLVLATASFIGPLVIGFAIDHFGYAPSLVALMVLSLIPAGVLLAFGGALPGGSGPRKEKKQRTADLKDPAVWRLLATSGLVQCGLDMFQFYMPVYGHSIELSAAAIGVIVAMYSAAAFVVRTAMPYLIGRFGEEKLLAYAFYLGAASFVLVPFFKSAVVLGAISFAFGLGMGCGQPITMMMTFSSSAEGRSGEALGLRLTVNHLTRVVGPVLFGALGSAFGLPSIFWLNALLLASGGALSAKKESGDKT
ncbi:MAG TPA: MFS transporter, partial [Burkholderiales bacterium]|nr:MFS transporter [Burkholderiales bacterium]